jgi:hypothetical protein
MASKYVPRLYLRGNEIQDLSKDIKPVSDKFVQTIIRKGQFQSKQHWIDTKMDENLIMISSQSIQIGLNKTNGVFFMCTPNLLMIDFDTDNNDEKRKVIELMQIFVNTLENSTKEKYLFDIYETDNGIHVFLVSHEVDSVKANVIKLMTQLQSDYAYIIHCVFRGFCIRIGPKIMKTKDELGYVIIEKEDMERIFIARPCYNGVCSIGHARPLKKLRNLINLSDELIKFFRSYYMYNIGVFDRKNILPTDEMMDEIKDVALEFLEKYNINMKGEYPYQYKTCSLYNEYEDILGEEQYSECKKYTIFDIYLISETLNKNINRDEIVYLIGTPLNLINKDISGFDFNYRFLLGYDTVRKMVFINFGNLLMIDWDYSDCLNKDKIIKLTHKFIENLEKSLLGIKNIAFRFYETDNGLHAFCTSHYFNHNNYVTQQIMLAMNCDPMYVGFVKLRGFAMRMTPKVTKTNKISDLPKYIIDEQSSLTQFVQRPLLDENDEPVVIGNGTENISIVELTKFIYNSQHKITLIPDIVKKLQRDDIKTLSEITDIVKTEYKKFQTRILLPIKDNEELKIAKIPKNNHSAYVEITEEEAKKFCDRDKIKKYIKIVKSDKKLKFTYGMLPKF